MTKYFSRTRMSARRSVSDAIIGMWVAVPIAGPPLLVLWWPWIAALSRHEGAPPLVFMTLVAIALAQFISILVVIEDAWIRPLDHAERVMWTLLAVFAAPCAGVAYWFARCHSTLPPPVQ
jgi:hypothetical protein